MAQVQIDNGAFAGDPTAETVYSAFGKVNSNAVIIDAEQVVQDDAIAANAAQISVIDGQITGLGVGLNDVNAQVSTNVIDIAANTAQILLQANMTYSVGILAVPLTNVPTSYQVLLSVIDGGVVARNDYEYRFSCNITSDQVDQLYYIRYRWDFGAWVELSLKTGIIDGSNVTTFWVSADPLTNNTAFDIEVRKDVLSLGNMTVTNAQAAIAQVN